MSTSRIYHRFVFMAIVTQACSIGMAQFSLPFLKIRFLSDALVAILEEIKLFNEKLSNFRRDLHQHATEEGKKMIKGLRWLLLNSSLATAYHLKEDICGLLESGRLNRCPHFANRTHD